MAGAILDNITSPVCVVTARSGDKINGMSVAWIMQGAFDPPYVVVSIAPERYSYSMITGSKMFGVNILASDQIKLGKHFGFASGRNVDKFKKINHKLSKNKLPILENIYSYIECTLINIYNAGDHDLFIGDPIDRFTDDTKKPLIFRSSDYF
ncbi:MAG: flavin reductase family protein [Candidatus Omnitrophota bacterium]